MATKDNSTAIDWNTLYETALKQASKVTANTGTGVLQTDGLNTIDRSYDYFDAQQSVSYELAKAQTYIGNLQTALGALSVYSEEFRLAMHMLNKDEQYQNLLNILDNV